MRLRSVLSVFAGLLFVLLASVPGLAQGEATPTPTLTPLPLPTYAGYPTYVMPEDDDCPVGYPAGWGTVTPSSMWYYYCSDCVDYIPTASPLPTASVTPTGTLIPTATPVSSWGLLWSGDVCPPARTYIYKSYYLQGQPPQRGADHIIRNTSCYATTSKQVYYHLWGVYDYRWVPSGDGYEVDIVAEYRQPSGCNCSVVIDHVVTPGDMVEGSKTGAVDVYGTCTCNSNVISAGVNPSPARAGEVVTASLNLEVQVIPYAPTPVPSPTSTPGSLGYCDVVDAETVTSWQGLVINWGVCGVIPAADLYVPILEWSASWPGLHFCLWDTGLAPLYVFGIAISLQTFVTILWGLLLFRVFIYS